VGGPGWFGLGWNNATGTWAANAWGGTSTAQDCTVTPNNNSCTTIHNWVNHMDADGNGIPGEEADRLRRVKSLAYWVSCACDASVAIPFSDTHGLISTTLYGGLGLAPIWCGSDPNARVPESEQQIVSACLLARVNLKGKHFPLSLRSLESGTALTTNEALTHRSGLAMYWGNLWKQPHTDYDTTTSVSTDLATTGGTWWNMERFSCSAASDQGGFGPYHNEPVLGRSCDTTDCAGHLECLGSCDSPRKRLGESGAWKPGDLTSYYKAVKASDGYQQTAADPTVAGGLTRNWAASSSGGTRLNTLSYRGKSWRALMVNQPYLLGMEYPVSTYNSYIANWVQLEAGSLLQYQATVCSQLNECEGPVQGVGGKLFGLHSGQAITLNLSGSAAPPYNFAGDPREAMSLAIRYSRAGLLGDGQCDVDAGCALTTASQCASGVVGPNGCIGGTASPGKLRIWVMNNKPMSVGWTPVHGSVSPYGKNIFPPTYLDTQYATAYIYPIYMQDSITTVTGATDQVPGTEYDTLRAWLSGDTTNTADAPNMDAAYYFTGPPPADADCKGPQGCWLFAGPKENVLVVQGAQWSYTSPNLPPGTYTFKITSVTGDADLYVRANGTATTSSWDCRPYLGTNQSETCSITLTGRGGYISAMVRGYASGTSTATLIGNN